jgi:SPP1 family predicted phage head-tail adaptor
MEAGKMDQRVTLQIKTDTRDSSGDPVRSWADSWTDWAEAISKGGTEYYAAQKVNAATEIVFRMRYKSTLATSTASANYRIKWLTRYFEILNINHVNGAYREILASCKEVV